MRKVFTILAVAGFVAAMMPSALAGGMAITAFDSLPDEFEAGRTYTLSYTILQHGVTPVDNANSMLAFTSVDSGQTITFQATATGDPGRYTVDVTVPAEGAWEMQVTQGPFEAHDFGVIEISPAADNPVAGLSWANVLMVVLPLAAVAAAWYTVRELRRVRQVGEVPTEIG
ncbi:MAG: FixH family protein [Acidimicrobiia bacterium]